MLAAEEIILETGRVARQAHGAVWIQLRGNRGSGHGCASQPLESPKDLFPSYCGVRGKRCTPRDVSPGIFSGVKSAVPSRSRNAGIPPDRPPESGLCSPRATETKCRCWPAPFLPTDRICPTCCALPQASAAVCLSPIPFDGPCRRGTYRSCGWRIRDQPHGQGAGAQRS